MIYTNCNECKRKVTYMIETDDARVVTECCELKIPMHMKVIKCSHFKKKPKENEEMEEIMKELVADTSGRCPYCNEVQFKDFHKPEDCAMKPELADTSGELTK